MKLKFCSSIPRLINGFANAIQGFLYLVTGLVFLSAALATAQLRESENNNYFLRADTLKPGSSITAAFSKTDLVDVFMFNVQSTSMYNCNSLCDYEKYALSSVLDADVRSMSDTSRTVLYGNINDRYGKLGFRLAGWLPPKSGWYYLIIKYKSTSLPVDSVKYQVRLTFGTPIVVAAVHHEVDDIVSEAQNRTPVPTDGTLVHGYLFKKNGNYNWNDLDLYRFEGAQGQSIVAETFTAARLTGEPWFIRDADTEIALLDQSGNETGYSNDDKETTSADPWETTVGTNNTFSRIQVESLPYTGTYYIRVGSYYNTIIHNEDASLSDSNPGGGEYLLSVVKQAQSAGVQFEISNQDNGLPLPGKLTAIGLPGTPSQGTFRFLHTVTGRGTLALPVGSYTMVFSHGPEYSLVQRDITLGESEIINVSARLQRLLDTSGYIGADMHLHALEGITAADKFGTMITALVAEDIEYAVATDHNAISDYQPRVVEMGLQNYIKTSPGDEISTAIGHFNAWPLDPKEDPVVSTGSAADIFSDARNKGAKIIQINHPRWPGIDYFTQMKLDPITGLFAHPYANEAFDAMELMNETEGWGFDVIPPNNPISVVQDWFHLLNRDKRYCATGNSDAHGLNGDKPGYPRNYIASSTDKPGEIDVNEICQAIQDGRVTVCDGHFTTFTINETATIGDQITDSDGTIRMNIRVQALPEISVDSVFVYGNGVPVAVFKVPESRNVDRFVKAMELHPTRDTWYCVISRGYTDVPIGLVMDDGGPIKPAGYTNPIWVDVDGNGVFDSLNKRTTVEGSDSHSPLQYSLQQNFPNPFNPSTTVEYTLPNFDHVSLRIYSVQGQEMVTLVDRQMPAGTHRVIWDAKGWVNGVYFIKLEAGQYQFMRKAVLLK
jgi:hypothetical protein